MAQVRMPEEMRDGVTIEDYLRKMDAAGIERSLLIAVRAGEPAWHGSFEIPYQQIAQYCDAYPDRFSGLAGVDPTRGVQQLKELDHAVNELGFVGAHFYPHWFRMPPDSALCYPIYSRCEELGIPIMMQVGQNLIYQKDVRLPSVAKPILLDQVAIDFPNLVLIGIHIGVPWTDEMIAMAWKHENVYIGIDAYAPKHLPASLKHYMNSYGSHKVMFGTDWPVIDPERAVSEIHEHALRPESLEKVMRGNAVKVFRLKADE
jgi:predicted TIM-barrel fold metal-dependent hydrolase